MNVVVDKYARHAQFGTVLGSYSLRDGFDTTDGVFRETCWRNIWLNLCRFFNSLDEIQEVTGEKNLTLFFH